MVGEAGVGKTRQVEEFLGWAIVQGADVLNGAASEFGRLPYGPLVEAMRDRAMLLITHRLVGMEEIDEILVMDARRAVERGTHEALTRSGGHYHRMLETQRELLVEPRPS